MIYTRISKGRLQRVDIHPLTFYSLLFERYAIPVGLGQLGTVLLLLLWPPPDLVWWIPTLYTTLGASFLFAGFWRPIHYKVFGD